MITSTGVRDSERVALMAGDSVEENTHDVPVTSKSHRYPHYSLTANGKAQGTG